MEFLLPLNQLWRGIVCSCCSLEVTKEYIKCNRLDSERQIPHFWSHMWKWVALTYMLDCKEYPLRTVDTKSKRVRSTRGFSSQGCCATTPWRKRLRGVRICFSSRSQAAVLPCKDASMKLFRQRVPPQLQPRAEWMNHGCTLPCLCSVWFLCSYAG